MKINKYLFIGHLLNTCILVSIGGWYGADGGWEPVVVFLTLLAPYFTSGYYILKSLVSNQQSAPLVEPLTEEDFITTLDLVSNQLERINGNSISVENMISSLSVSQINSALGILYGLERLGLVSIDEHKIIRFTSDRSASFVSSAFLSLKDSSEFIGDWKAEGCSNDEAKKMCRILTEIETKRISTQGNLALPSRKIQSSLAIIKANYQGEDRFLLQWSDAWGDGYYWFIGGICEPNDISSEACIRRELGEELDIPPAAIHSVTELGCVKDKRISSRLGAYTEYEYTIYSVSLDPGNKKVNDIHEEMFTVSSHVAWNQYHRKNRWHTWEELRDNPHLQRDAGDILSFIEKNPPGNIPMSTSVEIRAVVSDRS